MKKEAVQPESSRAGLKLFHTEFTKGENRVVLSMKVAVWPVGEDSCDVQG